MSYLMSKPAWFGEVGGYSVVSPACRLVLADWWDAWRLMWITIGAAIEVGATAWERLP